MLPQMQTTIPRAGTQSRSDVVISGAPGLPFTLTESGGGGICVAHDMRVEPPAPVHHSRNVTVDWVRSTRNGRVRDGEL